MSERPCVTHREQRAPGDVDPWFPTTANGHEATGIEHYAFAKRQCYTLCPDEAFEDCRRRGIENDERYGVWGGMTPAERNALKKGSAA